MVLFFLFAINSISSSLIVFPFKVKVNKAKKYKSPINQTEITIDKYLFHILNNFEFISEIEVGTPKQKVEVLFNFYNNYLKIIAHSTSVNPYFYNKSSSYIEIKENDPECNLKVYNPLTIQEIFHLKNGFYNNLNDFISSKDEIPHEFIIIFSKSLPKLNHQPNQNKYTSSNVIEIGILVNARYNDEHGIYKQFLNELREQGYIENQLHFLYFFDKYNNCLNNTNNTSIYDGLIVFGKHPHELLPNEFDISNLFWTDTYLSFSKNLKDENIEWSIIFDEVYIEFGNKIQEKFEVLRAMFDLNVEYIFPPFQFYEIIKKFFEPLNEICFEEMNMRLSINDGNTYRMIYCNYEKFEEYLKTFPKLVFQINDLNESFEFSYENFFNVINDRK